MRIASIDLRREAIIELDRVALARALLRDGDERAGGRLEGEATWIAVGKRAALKRALDGRVCLIYRVAFEDASGRLAASRLVPVLVEVTRSASRHPGAWVERLVEEADGLVKRQVEAECSAWRSKVVGTVTAFASARLRRELANTGQKRPDEHEQPGLFDRRAERARELQAAVGAESDQAAKGRMRTIETAANIVAVPPRLMLVLTPWS
jgi:hypothetical protein